MAAVFELIAECDQIDLQCKNRKCARVLYAFIDRTGSNRSAFYMGNMCGPHPSLVHMHKYQAAIW